MEHLCHTVGHRRLHLIPVVIRFYIKLQFFGDEIGPVFQPRLGSAKLGGDYVRRNQ